MAWKIFGLNEWVGGLPLWVGVLLHILATVEEANKEVIQLIRMTEVDLYDRGWC